MNIILSFLVSLLVVSYAVYKCFKDLSICYKFNGFGLQLIKSYFITIIKWAVVSSLISVILHSLINKIL